jgi:hypothetical protein
MDYIAARERNYYKHSFKNNPCMNGFIIKRTTTTTATKTTLPE